MSSTTLGQLPQGQKAVVTGLLAESRPFRRKLLAMGLTPGCEVEVVRLAPLGDPVEIALRGFRLCLRRAEAAGVGVEVIRHA